MTESKTCHYCGRAIEWRRKWADCWDEVRHCSDACRKARLGRQDEKLERTILDLLDARPGDATICPSEAARIVFPDAWKDRMEATRRAARRLVAAGRIVITQGGKTVDPSTAKGPIRLRKLRRP